MLVVGGGGGGGAGYGGNEGNGGGGAGGVGSGTLSLTATNYTINIGAGGNGGNNGIRSMNGVNTTVGGGSIFEIAYGGGGGAGSPTVSNSNYGPQSGGSGGGARGYYGDNNGASATRGLGLLTYNGYNGGKGTHFQAGGGGGGGSAAGGAGGGFYDGSVWHYTGGNGGNGYTWIDNNVYGGGGGGSGNNNAPQDNGYGGTGGGGRGSTGESNQAGSGSANTGGGGGAAMAILVGNSTAYANGGNGGSGIVAVAFRISTAVNATSTIPLTGYVFVLGPYNVSPWGTSTQDANAQWIWYEPNGTSGTSNYYCHYYKSFYSSTAYTGTGYGAFDNTGTVTINGNFVGNIGGGWGGNGNQFSFSVIVGTNNIDIYGANQGGPGGVICTFYDNNNNVVVHTDSSWTYSRSAT
jgi:hypothetical protein